MRVVIVGHGPSLKGAGRGAEIDSYDKVCRMKIGHKLSREFPADYGKRMDYLCSILKTWMHYWTLKLEEYWGYQNFPGQDVKLEMVKEHFGKTKVRLESEAVDHWLGVYRELADVRMDHTRRDGMRAKEGDEPWMSTGMGAIVIACAGHRPEKIALAGFDNTIASQRDGYKSMIRPEGHVYPPHAWDIENQMIPMVAEHYGVEICPM